MATAAKSAAKRKLSLPPGPGPSTRSKRTKGVEEVPMFDEHGHVGGESNVSFMPEDMAKWLPKPMVDLVVSSLNAEEWRAKMAWLVAMLWFKVHNMRDSFIDELLQQVRPTRDGVVDVLAEQQTVLDYQVELQSAFCDMFFNLALVWIKGSAGIKFVQQLQTDRERRVNLTRLTVFDVENWFEFGPRDYYALWYPVTFVTDPMMWTKLSSAKVGESVSKTLIQDLRTSCLAILVRFITILSTGKVKDRVISNSARLRVLDSTALRETSEWPVLIGKSERPQNTAAWEAWGTQYQAHKSCAEFKALIVRLANKIGREQTEASELAESQLNMQEQSQENGNNDGEGGPGDRELLGAEDSQSVEEVAEKGTKDVVGTVDSAVVVDENSDVEYIQGSFADRIKTEDEHFLETLDDVPPMPLELGDEFTTVTVGSHSEEPTTTPGLVTLSEFANIERENKMDWELDNRIIELLRPHLQQSEMASYVSNEAIRIALMGPMGVARWVSLACQEIVNRNDELCLLVDKKIQRYQKHIELLRVSTEAAFESVDRLKVLRDKFDEEVKLATQERKKLADAREWANQQKLPKILTGSSSEFTPLRGGSVRPNVMETPRRPAKEIGWPLGGERSAGNTRDKLSVKMEPGDQDDFSVTELESSGRRVSVPGEESPLYGRDRNHGMMRGSHARMESCGGYNYDGGRRHPDVGDYPRRPRGDAYFDDQRQNRGRYRSREEDEEWFAGGRYDGRGRSPQGRRYEGASGGPGEHYHDNHRGNARDMGRGIGREPHRGPSRYYDDELGSPRRYYDGQVYQGGGVEGRVPRKGDRRQRSESITVQPESQMDMDKGKKIAEVIVTGDINATMRVPPVEDSVGIGAKGAVTAEEPQYEQGHRKGSGLVDQGARAKGSGVLENSKSSDGVVETGANVNSGIAAKEKEAKMKEFGDVAPAGAHGEQSGANKASTVSTGLRGLGNYSLNEEVDDDNDLIPSH